MADNTAEALLLLGCPEVPVQTTLALYLAYALRTAGVHPVIAGTPSARSLLALADPEKHYISDIIDLDRCIGDLAEGRRDFSYCFVFIHNDAGISYAATIATISGAKLYTIIFGKEADTLAKEVTFPAETLAAKAIHNPLPLKNRIDRVITGLQT